MSAYTPPHLRNSTISFNSGTATITSITHGNPFKKQPTNEAQQTQVQPAPATNETNFPSLGRRHKLKPSANVPKLSLNQPQTYQAKAYVNRHGYAHNATATTTATTKTSNHAITYTSEQQNTTSNNEHTKYMSRSNIKIKQLSDPTYHKQREQSIIEEMRYSLSPDEFDDWYEHHYQNVSDQEDDEEDEDVYGHKEQYDSNNANDYDY